MVSQKWDLGEQGWVGLWGTGLGNLWEVFFGGQQGGGLGSWEWRSWPSPT